ncbi:MAG: molybdate ABC transporter substrate-binding protein [Phycisphaerales bacterium]|nr:MAG: molybdate ABC transporter substrate-binding protein [Phycisphaerales bacterium]
MRQRGDVLKKMLYAATAALLLLGGCKGDHGKVTRGGSAELVLYCGAGIRPPVDEVIAAFEKQEGVKVVPDYAGSEVLLSKIKVHRRGDLYMPGDKYYVDKAEEAGMISSRRPVFYWIPTILVRKGNPKNISGLVDLQKPGLKVGLGDPNACAIGRTADMLLSKTGISRESLKENLVYQSLTVNELGVQIQAGSLDAVIVWDAMARYYAEYGDQIAIRREQNVISTVDIGVLKFSKDSELAERFIAFITSGAAGEIFAKHGYETKLPE